MVLILNARTSKIPSIMQLMCCLLMAAARFNFSFSAQHIPGVHSKVADALPIFIGRSSPDRWLGWLAEVQVVGSLSSSKSSDNPTKTANRVDLSPPEQCCRSFLVEGLTPTPTH